MDDLSQHQDIAKSLEEAGIASAADCRRLFQLKQVIVTTGSISDDEVDWVIALARNPLVATSENSLGSHNLALGEMLQSMSQVAEFTLTPSQADKLFAAALDYFPMDSSDFLTISNGYRAMMWLKEKRAIPLLTLFLDDSRATVRYRAKEALTSLGHFSEQV